MSDICVGKKVKNIWRKSQVCDLKLFRTVRGGEDGRKFNPKYTPRLVHVWVIDLGKNRIFTHLPTLFANRSVKVSGLKFPTRSTAFQEILSRTTPLSAMRRFILNSWKKPAFSASGQQFGHFWARKYYFCNSFLEKRIATGNWRPDSARPTACFSRISHGESLNFTISWHDLCRKVKMNS